MEVATKQKKVSRADLTDAIWLTLKEVAIFLNKTTKEVKELYNDGGYFMRSRTNEDLYYMESVEAYLDGRPSRPSMSKHARQQAEQKEGIQMERHKKQLRQEKKNELTRLRLDLQVSENKYGVTHG